MIKKLNRTPIIISLIIFLLVGIAGWVVLAVKSDPQADPYARYQVPDDFTRDDLHRMIDVMKEDGEFAFYFTVLSEEQRAALRQEIINIILANRSQADMLGQIKSAYDSIRGVGSTFYYLDFPEDYAQYPGKYLQFEEIFWTFLQEEFKLAVLGVFYKVHHDNSFVFQWDQITILAAGKLRDLWDEHIEYYVREQKR